MDLQDKEMKVVLFLPRLDPGSGGDDQRPPLQLLALSGILLDKFSIVTIDAAIEDNYKGLVIQHCETAVCLGISCILGYQVYDGADVAREVKKRFPALPIVFGGWFPTVRPNIFFKEGIADVVVRGQGEKTFLEVVNSFVNGIPLDNIQGIIYKKNDEIITNPERLLVDMNELPQMPYHLIDYERYISSSSYDRMKSNIRRRNSLLDRIGLPRIDPNIKTRTLHYFSSWGCPDNCAFCCSPGVTKRRWTALDPLRMVDEIEGLIKKYDFNFVSFCDANFGVSEKRVKKFCEELLKRDLKLNWIATAEARSIERYGTDTLDSMVQSGCFAIFIGAESACMETISLIGKHITPEEIEISVDRLTRKGILPLVSYVIGFPGESLNGINYTLEQICKLHLKYPEMLARIFVYFPLPGSFSYSLAIKSGYEEPKTVEDWGSIRIDLINDSITHESTEKDALIRKIIKLRDSYLYWGFNVRWERPRLHIIGKLLERSARFRIRNRIFRFPIEFWLYDGLKKVHRGFLH